MRYSKIAWPYAGNGGPLIDLVTPEPVDLRGGLTLSALKSGNVVCSKLSEQVTLTMTEAEFAAIQSALSLLAGSWRGEAVV